MALALMNLGNAISTNTIIRCTSYSSSGTTANIIYNEGFDVGTTASTNAYNINWIQYSTYDNPEVRYIQGITRHTYETVYNTAATIQTSSGYYIPRPLTAAEKLKQFLNKRMSPDIISSCKPLGYTDDIREIRARETLRRVLGEDKFRDFVRRGSVSVRAKSGLVYQIFPAHDFTKVYDRGKLIERLCVVLQGGFPPTDSLIMRYLMILNNEKQFRSYANVHEVGTPILPLKPDQRTLVEVFKEMKRVA